MLLVTTNFSTGAGPFPNSGSTLTASGLTCLVGQILLIVLHQTIRQAGDALYSTMKRRDRANLDAMIQSVYWHRRSQTPSHMTDISRRKRNHLRCRRAPKDPESHKRGMLNQTHCALK